LSRPILEGQGLTKRFYPGNRVITAVDAVDLQLMPGECLGLVGESGCGKSTLARLMTRLEKADSGRIILEGNDITSLRGKSLRQIYSKVQMVFQDAASSFDGRMRIGDSIMEVMENICTIKSTDRQTTMFNLLEIVGLKLEYAQRFPHQLSGGECRRAAIARAIAVHPEMLICDEATSGLDVSVQAHILTLLQQLKSEMNLALLFITHDLAVVSCFCERVSIMYDGHIVETGLTCDIINNPQHSYTRLLLASVIPAEGATPWRTNI
jgi:ABC-type oligopeptide transport system ATPase subunit